MEKNEERTDSAADVRRRERKLIYRILIVLALGVGFGKIISVDSAHDRAIQNYRMQQLPNVLEKKSKELAEKGVTGDRFNAEMDRVLKASLADANKARPTLSANDRSRWATRVRSSIVSWPATRLKKGGLRNSTTRIRRVTARFPLSTIPTSCCATAIRPVPNGTKRRTGKRSATSNGSSPTRSTRSGKRPAGIRSTSLSTGLKTRFLILPIPRRAISTRVSRRSCRPSWRGRIGFSIAYSA